MQLQTLRLICLRAKEDEHVQEKLILVSNLQIYWAFIVPILGNPGMTHYGPIAFINECNGYGFGQAWVTEDGCLLEVSKGAKIRNRYNQVPRLAQDTNGKVTHSQLDTTNESQGVSHFPAGEHKAHKQTRTKS